MAVSALIVTLPEVDPEAVLRVIAADPRFVVGPREGARRAALVLDTPDHRSDRAAHDWLREAGATFVDVVAVYLDDVTPDTVVEEAS